MNPEEEYELLAPTLGAAIIMVAPAPTLFGAFEAASGWNLVGAAAVDPMLIEADMLNGAALDAEILYDPMLMVGV